jgi:hypothetical protein
MENKAQQANEADRGQKSQSLTRRELLMTQETMHPQQRVTNAQCQDFAEQQEYPS